MRKWVLFIILFTLVIGLGPSAYASNTQSTGYSVSLNTDGEYDIAQDAYLPYGAYLSLGLSGAEDLYVGNGKMYIADTGNQRCLVVDIETSEVMTLGEGFLNKPRGIAADPGGNIYVADYGAREAYRYSPEGELLQTFTRPADISFGANSEFNPSKIMPDGSGGIYLVNEGTTAGLVHMGEDGVFLGYFGAKSVSMTPFEAMLRLILNQEQMLKFLNKTPPSFAAIFMGQDDYLYSIEKGGGASIARHNLGGFDMLNPENIPAVDDPRGICVTNDSRMFMVTQEGYIYELTREGYMLSRFGGPANGEDREGLFYVTSGIGVDESGKVYVLDFEKNYIQVFTPTPGQRQIHQAMDDYNNGLYSRSLEALQQVININNQSFFAHFYAGKIYMQQGRYTEAAEHFETANSIGDYSQAYWELRNIWLQKYILYLFGAVILFFIIMFLLKKRGGLWKKTKWRAWLMKYRLYRDISLVRRAAMHPIDHAYDVKTGRAGSYAAATVLYLIFFALYVVLQVGSGFIYAIPIRFFYIFDQMIYVLGSAMLFCIGNYFISAIHDGNGTFRAVYITLAYNLCPAIICLPLIIIFSNVATLDDIFLVQASLTFCVAWCACNEVAALIEIHEYNFFQTVRNLLLTALFMAVTIIVLSLSYLLLKQIYDFIASLIMEVTIRA